MQCVVYAVLLQCCFFASTSLLFTNHSLWIHWYVIKVVYASCEVCCLCCSSIECKQHISFNTSVFNWGKPERAPHKREVRAVGLSVCLSVCRSVRTFMTRKYTRVIKTHDSESRGQEEAGRTQRMSELFTRSTALKFVIALNKPP